MGKQDFIGIYEGAKQARGGQLSLKLSYFSDPYRPEANFAGLIVYHKSDKHDWEQLMTKRKGGYKGKSCYVIIQDTSKWSEFEFKRAGQGKVHDALYSRLCDESFQVNTACCGGFAIVDGHLRFSSIWLNLTTREDEDQVHKWRSDGSKELSEGEQALVYKVIAHWLTDWQRCKEQNISAPAMPLGNKGCLVERAIVSADRRQKAIAQQEQTKAETMVDTPLDSLPDKKGAYTNGKGMPGAYLVTEKVHAFNADHSGQYVGSKGLHSMVGGKDLAACGPHVEENLALEQLRERAESLLQSRQPVPQPAPAKRKGLAHWSTRMIAALRNIMRGLSCRRAASVV